MGQSLIIEEVNLNKDTLLQIQKLDDSFYGHNTEFDWYLERYKNYNTAFVLCDTITNTIVGYALGVPIKEELFLAITSGVLNGDIEINPKMFVKESKYVYISSCVIFEKYRDLGYGSKLIKSVVDKYKDKYICAIYISDGGYRILNRVLIPFKVIPHANIFVSNNYYNYVLMEKNK